MDETTRSLSRVLQHARSTGEAEELIQQADRETELRDHLNRLLAEKDVSVSELIDRSGINRNYIYNILNGQRKNPGRDKVIALCIGLGADFRETNRALELVHLSPLYPRDERDIRIAVAINQGMNSVTKVNLLLEESGLPPLDI